MANELVAALPILEGNSFGRHVITQCKLQMFQNQKYRWVEEMRGSKNRKRVFDSVFGKDSKRLRWGEKKKRKFKRKRRRNRRTEVEDGAGTNIFNYIMIKYYLE